MCETEQDCRQRMRKEPGMGKARRGRGAWRGGGRGCFPHSAKEKLPCRGWATTSGGSGYDFGECGPQGKGVCALMSRGKGWAGQESAFVKISWL